MITSIISRIVILFFGTLYPSYASYKAVRTKNVKEYVKWMMYWIVFALFSCIETFTDIFLSWFPFYYELKIIIVLWLLSPATKGSSTLYRKFVHPMLTKHEHDIDEYISRAKDRGYSTFIELGTKGVNYATSVIMQTAIKGGGNLVSTLRRSYSLSDLSESNMISNINNNNSCSNLNEIGNLVKVQQQLQQQQQQQQQRSTITATTTTTRSRNSRSNSNGRKKMDVFFPAMDVDPVQQHHDENYDYVRSTEDISSGYSSAEANSAAAAAFTRTTSLTNASRSRLKPKKSEDMETDSIIPLTVYLLSQLSNQYKMQSIDTSMTPTTTTTAATKSIIIENENDFDFKLSNNINLNNFNIDHNNKMNNSVNLKTNDSSSSDDDEYLDIERFDPGKISDNHNNNNTKNIPNFQLLTCSDEKSFSKSENTLVKKHNITADDLSLDSKLHLKLIKYASLSRVPQFNCKTEHYQHHQQEPSLEQFPELNKKPIDDHQSIRKRVVKHNKGRAPLPPNHTPQ